MSLSENLKCPACNFNADVAFTQCPKCGIIVQKYLEKQAERQKQAMQERPKAQSAPPIQSGVMENSNYLKVVIGILLCVIAVGAYMFTKRGSTAAEQPKPMYVAQQNTNAQQPGSSQPTNKTVPQVAIDAVDAMKKLQAKTQVGIAYKDYSPALADAKFALNLYTESAQSKEFPELSQSLNSAFETFKMAGDVWSDKFSGSSVSKFSYKTNHPTVFLKFPDAAQDYSKGGVIISEQDGGAFSIDTMISFLFSKANEEVQKASAMIAR